MNRYISPIDDRARDIVPFAPRPASLSGVTIGLLDISKTRGVEFLDRLEFLLASEHDAHVVRLRKPTFARVAPAELIAAAARCGGIVEALAD